MLTEFVFSTLRCFATTLTKDRKKIFHGGRGYRGVKKSVTTAGRRRTILKLHWLKHPKTVRKKTKSGRKINAQNLIFGIYLLILRFSGKCLKANNNWLKRSLFYNIVSLKKPRPFYEPRLIQHCGKYNPLVQPKTLLTFFKIFSADMFQIGIRKNIALHHF